MQYLYLFIFIFFIMLNVMIGLASSRAKRRRASAGRTASQPTAAETPDEVSELLQHTEAHESILRPQTAENIVESFFTVEEEKASLPGGGARSAEEMTSDASIPDVGPTPEKTEGTGDRSETEIEELKPMIDISKPEGEVTLSIEKNLLESEVETRSVERRKAQDEVYQARDMYWHRDAEMDVWERIDELTPLKRAILLSEILGPPRSLSEGRHSE